MITGCHSHSICYTFNLFPNKPLFLCFYSTSHLETLWEKEKLLVMSNFSFSHFVFYCFGELFHFFHKIQNCRLQILSVWKSLKFVIWERVNIIMILTLSQTTNFELCQTERYCRRQFQLGWKWQKVHQTGRKHCGKRRNCSLRAISPFPSVISKGLYCRHVKTRDCLGKG